MPLTLLLTLVCAVHIWLGMRAGGGGIEAVLPSLGIAMAAVLVVWLVALATSFPMIKRAAVTLGEARTLERAALEHSSARVSALTAEIQTEHDEEGRDLSDTFRDSGEEWQALMREGQKKLDEQVARLPEKLERLHQRKLEQ